ncbi:MAG: hypothetical protein ACRC0G_17005, partial [Fusobacteriaceae bacterium]
LRGRGIGFENLERRLNSGLVGVESILKSTYASGDEIRELTRDQSQDVENLSVKNNPIKQIDTKLKLIEIESGAIIDTPAFLIKNK